MAAFTSSQTGNWSATSTWGGSGPPGNGDTVVIANGHTVTVNDARVVGTSPSASGGFPSSWDLKINATGKLLIAAGGTLDLRGYAVLAAGGSQVGLEIDGGTLRFDGSVSSVGYDFYNSDAYWSGRSVKMRNGGTITSVSGYPNGRLAGTYGSWSMDFVGVQASEGDPGSPIILERLGRSNDLRSIEWGNTPGWWPAPDVQMVDVLFRDCYPAKMTGNPGATNNVLRRVTVLSSQGTGPFDVTFNAGSANAYVMDDCAFDCAVNFNGLTNCSVTGNLFANGVTRPGGAYNPSTWSGNLRRLASGIENGMVPGPAMSDEYIISQRDNNNAKALNPTVGGSPASATYTDITIEAPNDTTLGDPDSDGEYVAALAVGWPITFTGLLCIPMHSGKGLRVGEWLSDSAGKVTYQRCTFPLLNGTASALGFGHGGDNGVQTERAVLKDCIGINLLDTDEQGRLTGYISNDNTDPIVAADSRNNVAWRAAASRYPSAIAPGYGHKQSNTADVFGVGDVQADPYPTWPTTPSARRAQLRRLSTWGSTVLGLTGNNHELEDDAIDAILKRHLPDEPGHVSRDATPAALRTWVRAGWGSTSALLETASTTGGWIGAIDGEVASGVAPRAAQFYRARRA